jgi:hypothetical protein
MYAYHSPFTLPPFSFGPFALPFICTSSCCLPFTTPYIHIKAPVLKVISSAEPANNLSTKSANANPPLYLHSIPYSPNSFPRTQDLKQRIRIKLIMPIALLDPNPVPESYAAAKSQGGQEGDGVGRGEEEEVEDEGQGGDGVEGEVGVEREGWGPVGEDEFRVDLVCLSDGVCGVTRCGCGRSYGSQTPVEHADQALHGRAGYAEPILDREDLPAHGHVRQ